MKNSSDADILMLHALAFANWYINGNEGHAHQHVATTAEKEMTYEKQLLTHEKVYIFLSFLFKNQDRTKAHCCFYSLFSFVVLKGKEKFKVFNLQMKRHQFQFLFVEDGERVFLLLLLQKSHLNNVFWKVKKYIFYFDRM